MRSSFLPVGRQIQGCSYSPYCFVCKFLELVQCSQANVHREIFNFTLCCCDNYLPSCGYCYSHFVHHVQNTEQQNLTDCLIECMNLKKKRKRADKIDLLSLGISSFKTSVPVKCTLQSVEQAGIRTSPLDVSLLNSTS